MSKSTANIDLVPKEALEQLRELDSQLDITKNNLKELLVPVVDVSNELHKSATNYKELIDLINKLNVVETKKNDVEKRTQKVLSDIEKAQRKLNDSMSSQAKEIAILREQTRRNNQENRNAAKEVLSHANSLDALSAKLSKMKTAARGMDKSSEEYAKLREEIGKLNAEILNEESKMGVWGRNVGNYSSAFSGLKYNIQQVARELPSLTIGAGQFFLAISNNLPMLVDELNRTKEINKALRDEGKKTVPVWRQVLSGIVSWQTALVVGITLLASYHKEIFGWIKGLWGVNQALMESDEIMKAFGSHIAKDTIQLNIMVDSLKKTTKGTKEYDEAKKKIIDQYGGYLKGQKDEIRNLEDLDSAYKLLTQSIIKNSIQKGLQDANAKSIEEYTKRIGEALEGVLDKFKDKFGDEVGAEKFIAFKVGFTSDNEELRNQALKIYEEFNEKVTKTSVGAGGRIKEYEVIKNKLEGVYSDIKDANEAFNDFQKDIQNMQGAIEKIYGIDTVQRVDSLIEKQKDLRKEAELMPESTEKEIKLKNQRLKQIDDEISRLQQLGIETEKERTKQETEEKKLRDFIEKLNLRELDARNKLDALKLKGGIENNKLIVKSEVASYEERIDALHKYEDALKKSVLASAYAEEDKLVRETASKYKINISDPLNRAVIEKKVTNQIALIREKSAREIEKIEAESSKIQIDIEADRVRKSINNINLIKESKLRSLDLEESEAYWDLSKDYGAMLLNEEYYQAKKNAIADKYTLLRYNAEIESLTQMLDHVGLTEDEKTKLMEERAKLEVELAAWTKDKVVEIEEEKAEKIKETFHSIYELADTLVKARFDNRLKELDEESEVNEEWSENEKERIENLEESGAISKEQAEARKAAIDEQAEAREENIENKRKEIRKKQAIYEKAMAIADIARETASAVLKIKAQVAILLSNPFTAAYAAVASAQIPWILAAGAAQTATIAATPIPEYADGTRDHPGGLAIVGDGGKSELVIANGKIFKTPSQDTLVDLPPHAVVLPDYDIAIPKIPQREDKVMRFDELSSLMKDNNHKMTTLLKLTQKRMKNEQYARELNNIQRINR